MIYLVFRESILHPNCTSKVEGKKIAAIKIVRELTQSGLKEAKFAVDHITERFTHIGVKTF